MSALLDIDPTLIPLEIEQAVLGCTLANAYRDVAVVDRVGAVLVPDDFGDATHRVLFEGMLALSRQAKTFGPVALRDQVRSLVGDPDQLPAYLAALVKDAPSLVGIDDLAAIVRDRSMRRLMRQAMSEAFSATGALDRPAADLVDGAVARLSSLRQGSGIAWENASVAELADRFVADLDAPATATGAMPTGLVDLDRQLGGGPRAGRLIVVAGRPGMGKTAIAIDLARRLAHRDKGVLFVSLEIDRREIVARLVAAETARMSGGGVPYRDLVSGEMDAGRRETARRAAANVRALPIQVDTTGGLSVDQIETRLRLARQARAIDVVVIDYLQLITSPRQARDRGRHDEIAEQTRALKQMSKRYGVAVILLSQLNRGVEGRDDKRPSLADLRASGAIEEDADAVMFAYRPAYYVEKSPAFRKGQPEAVEAAIDQRFDLEIIVDKNRLGSCGTVKLWCDVALNALDGHGGYRR